jgi:sugar phosphate isomerase/epimerase
LKLAFSSNGFTRFSLSDAIDAIADAGYAGIEILADEPHAYPLRLDADFASRIARHIDRRGLIVSNVNANCTFGYWRDAPPEPFFEPSLISPVERYRTDRLMMIGKTIDFARAVGASCISITSGRLLGGVPPRRGRVLIEDNLRRVLDLADRAKINVGIEYEPGLFIERADELIHWINRIDHPRLGANLDIGHCQVIGEPIRETVIRLRDRIWNLHIEGMAGAKHYHLVPGDEEDTMDWSELRRCLGEIGYDRCATVELYTESIDPMSAARRSIEVLRTRFLTA